MLNPNTIDITFASVHTNSTKMTYDYEVTDLQIYKAALCADWESVSQIFEQRPELMTKQITHRWETPLMIAVGTNCSHHFVKQLLDRIIAVGAENELVATNYEGNNALHYAATVGNKIDAKLLVRLNPEMPLLRNYFGNTPLVLAASAETKDTLSYLVGVTTYLPGREEGISPYTGVGGGDLITRTIQAGFLDVALKIVAEYPDILLQYDLYSQRPLNVLATKPEFFRSGSGFGFWDGLIYSLIHVKKSEVRHGEEIREDAQVNSFSNIFNKFTTGFWSVLQYLAPPIKNIHAIKVRHIQSNILVKDIFKFVIENVNHEIAWQMLGSAIATAVKYGIHELVEECISTYPSIIWYDYEGFFLFHSAIKQRQVQVYNLVHQMTSHKVFVASHVDDKKENALHIVAKLAPPLRLNIVTGAALQMQRELQWFKEVENFVNPSYKEALNIDNKTPRMVFTDEHKDLLKEGRQWMKDTASFCTVVATLIVTVTFAAAVTVPGGNEDDGKPLFLNKGTFMLFIVSDAIALIFSSTSMLTFLGIFTSNYAEDDFLHVLPRRMAFGLLTLFLSLAMTMMAFGATLALVLHDKVSWIAAPLVIATSAPVCLFVFLQFSLPVELVKSTYGRSIFHLQNDRRIH